ncbi:trigger factor [Oscillospiraceae bacterium Marseille-Q3528]|nr:trigger factor [Oscillospiraceae bacterium Marseille-Q3528]WNV57362.1 trigger factor [Oscillospiraceae bacterium NTUH-002-81]
MSVQVENLEKNMAKLTIEVSADDLEKALQAAYLKEKNKISVPGFRKGKVPRAMIEKMYGPEIFYDDAANRLIPDAYAEAADESKLEIASQPKIDVVQLEKGKPFIFTAEVAVKPEVTLGEYKGLEVEKTDTAVTDEEVDAQVEKERDSNARTITVEDRPVQKGDQTIIDFEGFVDGVAFEGGKGEDYPLTIGSDAFIPGFEDQLIGAEKGAEVEVKVQFPAEYHAEDLAGKPAVFKVTVKEIKAKELPALDDDFAQDVSEFNTLEEYKADVRKKLEEKKEAAAKEAKEEAAIAKAIENAQMDIPEAMIDTQTRQMMDEFASRLQQQGLALQQYYQFTGMDNDKLAEQMKPNALKRIQTRLVLEAVVKAEDIKATEEEYKAEVEKMAKMYQMETEKLEQLIGEAEAETMKEDIAVQKAADLIRDTAKEV